MDGRLAKGSNLEHQISPFGKLPQTSIIVCFTFLHSLSYYNYRIVCKNWFNTLKSVLAENILSVHTVVAEFNATPAPIRTNTNYIFLLLSVDSTELHVHSKKDLTPIKQFEYNFPIQHFRVSDTYLAIQFPEFCTVFELDTDETDDEVCEILLKTHQRENFFVDETSFYWVDSHSLHIYDLKNGENFSSMIPGRILGIDSSSGLIYVLPQEQNIKSKTCFIKTYSFQSGEIKQKNEYICPYHGEWPPQVCISNERLVFYKNHKIFVLSLINGIYFWFFHPIAPVWDFWNGELADFYKGNLNISKIK